MSILRMHTKERGRRTMINFGIEVGEKATFAKTIGESDIYLFAGVTGDFSPNHVNDQFM